MVWNDYFDLEQDRRERPFRPLPSGRVTRGAAFLLGAVLLALGVGLAALSGVSQVESHRSSPALVALVLAGAILLYDGWLKRTWAGPLSMGTCRLLNVLLGLSAPGFLDPSAGAHLALIVGLYTTGLTWFARTEAQVSRQEILAGSALVMLSSLLVALPLPVRAPPGATSVLFPYLLTGLGFLVGIPVCRAISRPAPALVQAAVKQALLGLVVLDATLATVFAREAGLAIFLLLIPILLLSRWRWLYAT
jgi:4-hydroxybenzoate polyprenyltransferase